MSTTMTTAPAHQRLMASGHELDAGPEAFGQLRSSIDVAGDPATLRQRMQEDGYLFLPGYLDRDDVLAARAEIVGRLAEQGYLMPETPPREAVAKPGTSLKFAPDFARDNEPLRELLYTGRMMDFYRQFLGGEVLHFDYTWLRAVAPGRGTAPHGDSVFMNRGTSNLYTAWVPIGDIDFVQGGLIVLERSHDLEDIKATYGQKDVDVFCENDDDAAQYASGDKWWSGSLSDNPVDLRAQLQRRWLSAEFKAGDLLTFTLYTLHGSLDNQSDRIRLSSDSRYQLASEPADERWIGEQPIGHGAGAKRGMIC